MACGCRSGRTPRLTCFCASWPPYSPPDGPSMPRAATIRRETAETKIDLTVNLDGTGAHTLATGVGVFDHMLTHRAKHGMFDLAVQCRGDLHVDSHHTVEDV